MNKLFFTKQTAILLTSVFLFISCMDKDVYHGGKNQPINPTEAFDFSLTKEVKVNIDYNFNNDYYIIFELYDRNPVIEGKDSQIKDETLLPVFSAATDKKGQYSGSIILPSDITELWLYSEYLGAVSPVKVTVSDNEISFSQEKYIASMQTKTRATTTEGYNYPDSYKLLPGADWDIKGLPTNLEAELSMPPADILYSIKETYTKKSGKRINEIHKDWLNNNTTSEIKITKDTEISLIFINGTNNFNNAVGYFTYPTGTVPTVDNIQRILAFPHASPLSKTLNGGASLICGHEMKLQYWNEKTQEFEAKFPAGVTIGWWLESGGFKEGNIAKNYGTRYSYSSMNSDGEQRVVALRNSSTDQIVAIGLEDNNDMDYCDAVFYVKIEESDAISPEGPVLPPVDPPANLEYTVYGTLAFEDQWPSEGDYDLNDVVVEYRSTIYKSAYDNSIYKVVDEFTPIHNGATYACGFGYQLTNLDPAKVRSIKIEGPDGWVVETGQSYPTVTLFNDIKQVLKQKFTVTTEMINASGKTLVPPYNPFIFANDRSIEVHPVNYPPTGKADLKLFNTKDDVSNASAGVYYIARYKGEVSLMPFGINLPKVLDFNIPAEGVKIYDTYPGFIEWVKSSGKKNTDWHKK